MINDNQIINRFKKHFDNVFKGYEKSELSDLFAGYSLRGEYPKNVINYLGISKDKHYLPFFLFYLDNDSLKNHQYINKTSIGLIIKVEFLLRDKDFFDKEIIYTNNNNFVRNKIFLPLNIVSRGDFIYDFQKDKFFRTKKNKLKNVSLREIYNQVMCLHIARCTTLIGLLNRIKILLLRSLPSFLIKIASGLCSLIHWIINGVMFRYNPIIERIDSQIKQRRINPPKVRKKGEIDFFGYKVAAWTLASYSLINLVMFVIFFSFNLKPGFIKVLFEYSFLTIVYAVLSIIVYDKLLPVVLKKIIKFLNEIKFTIDLKELKLNF